MKSVVRVSLLGPVQVERNKEVIRGFESRKALSLLCYLATQDRPVSRTYLADMFWGDKSEARGRGNLSRVLNNLGNLLPNTLEIEREQIAFRRDADHWLDIREFETLVAKEDPALLTRAVALYRDEFMAGIYIDDCPEFETWLVAERERWHRRVIQALLIVIDYHSRRGEHAQAMTAVDQLLTLDPWSEQGHQQKMRLFALTGQRSAAMTQYETCRRILADALDVEPSAETTALYDRIRNQELTKSRAESVIKSSNSFASQLLESVANQLPFAGRAEEHEWLIDRWEEARDGLGRLTLVEGEAGIGKTRLIEEVLRFTGDENVTILRGCCYEFGAPVPYQPIAAALRMGIQIVESSILARDEWELLTQVWLAELAQLLPEIRESRPDLPELSQTRQETHREKLFEATARFLLALAADQGPVILLLDDLHWADQATIDLLRYLVYRLSDASIWLLGAYRREEVGSDHPFASLRRALRQQERVATLSLKPLNAKAITELIHRLVAFKNDELTSLVQLLTAKSEGNPFILYQIIQNLQKEGIWEVVDGKAHLNPDWMLQLTAGQEINITIPATVKELILDRIERLSPAARYWLEIAAVIGHQFSPDLLQAASASQESPDVIVQEWIDRHLVSFQPPDTYDFTHGMIRQVIYENLPIWRKQRLHGQIARALEELHTEETDKLSAELAYHYRESGDHIQARSYFLAAAEWAERAYAWDAAVHFYSQALALLEPNDATIWYDVLSRRERVYNITSQRTSQKADLLALENLAEKLRDDARRATVLCRHAEWALRTGHFDDGIQMAQQSIELARRVGRHDITIISRHWGALCYCSLGDYEQARVWAHEALTLAEESGDQVAGAQALGILGDIALSQGFLEQALYYMEAAVDGWKVLDDFWHLATSLNDLSRAYQRLGNYQGALVCQLEARQLATLIGDVHLDANCLISLATIYHALRQYNYALDIFHEALALAQIAGDPELEANVLLSRAHTLVAAGHIEQAVVCYRASLEVQEKFHILTMQADTLNGLADCYAAEGRIQEALASLQTVESNFHSLQTTGLSATLIREAEVQSKLGHVEESYRTIERILQALGEPDSHEEVPPEIWKRVLDFLETAAENDYARELLQRTHDLLLRYTRRLANPDLRLHFLRAATSREIELEDRFVLERASAWQ